MITTAGYDRILNGLAKGWTRGDHNAVLTYFADDIVYTDGVYYSFAGKPELAAFFEKDGATPQFCEFKRSLFDEFAQLGCAEYVYRGTYNYFGTVWIRFKDGLITDWCEYQHRSEA